MKKYRHDLVAAFMDVFGWWEKGTNEQGMITECCELQYRKRRAESYEYMQQADLP